MHSKLSTFLPLLFAQLYELTDSLITLLAFPFPLHEGRGFIYTKQVDAHHLPQVQGRYDTDTSRQRLLDGLSALKEAGRASGDETLRSCLNYVDLEYSPIGFNVRAWDVGSRIFGMLVTYCRWAVNESRDLPTMTKFTNFENIVREETIKKAAITAGTRRGTEMGLPNCFSYYFPTRSALDTWLQRDNNLKNEYNEMDCRYEASAKTEADGDALLAATASWHAKVNSYENENGRLYVLPDTLNFNDDLKEQYAELRASKQESRT